MIGLQCLRGATIKFDVFTVTTLFLITFFLLCSCRQADQNSEKLRIYGEVKEDFAFRNQDNQLVTADIFQDKIYVTDFFFTTCTTICPIMSRQMYRVYEAFKDNPDVLILSHTIDPDHDTVEVLKRYARGLGIKTEKWQMVTGPQEEIFAMAGKYMLGALKNDEAPDGYIHSGSFAVVDKKRRIRGYYNGTDEQEINQLIADVKELLNEK